MITPWRGTARKPLSECQRVMRLRSWTATSARVVVLARFLDFALSQRTDYVRFDEFRSSDWSARFSG
jgi:hypothetical protein